MNTIIVTDGFDHVAEEQVPTVIVVSEESEAAEESEDDEDSDGVTITIDSTPLYILIGLGVLAFLAITTVIIYVVIRRYKRTLIQA